jgi:ABC-2 type transport system permease protein
MMRGALPIYKRELGGYFATPVAYVFIVIFLLLSGVFAFNIGGLLERGQADMRTFFNFHPWLYLFLMPAVAMRLWAEERKSGTIELLMTLPVTKTGAVVGKFLAAWTFAGVALILTFPAWITINYLGDPDNGAAASGYIGSWLMAGAFLAIGSCVSALTRNQVIAFVVSVVVCLIFLLAGHPPVMEFVSGWVSQAIGDAVASFSFLTRFESISKGVISPRDLVFFFSLIGVALAANVILVEAKKS